MERRVSAFLILGAALFLMSGCKKKKTEPQKKPVPAAETPSRVVQVPEEEKPYSPLEEYKKLKEGKETAGSFVLYGEGEFCPVPENAGIWFTRIFGLDGDEMYREKPVSEILIELKDERLEIRIPASVYKKNPEMYVEAEHDGECFCYKEKESLEFDEKGYESYETTDYFTSVHFVNRNLYSKSDLFTVRLKDCKSDELLYEKDISVSVPYCNYVVYNDEYKSPFGFCITNLKEGDKKKLIYRGDRIIIYYGYYDNHGISYVPFASLKTNNKTDGVCATSFSILEEGQYRIDIYNEETGEIRDSSSFDYLYVDYDRNRKEKVTRGTEWKVNAPEGLRVRSAPWGEKIGLLEDGALLVQTENTVFAFYDCIDGAEGFWIPVKVPDGEKISLTEEKYNLLQSRDETVGWVFSGFLETPEKQ